MKVALKTHTGKLELPAVLLIHGLGMNNYFWVDPKKCFILGGLAPLEIFLTETPEKPINALSFGFIDPDIQSLWNYLENEGFSLASWTQRQPLGPIQLAVDELRSSIAAIQKKWPDKPLYLIGHSRGGLIARRFLLEEPGADIKGIITISSPHSGTEMAKFSRYLRPAGILLEKIIPSKSRATLTKALGRLSNFLQSPAIEELQPGSEFMGSIKKPLGDNLKKLSFGGTNPALFQMTISLPGNNFKVIKFPDMLAGLIPSDHLPKELTPGLGDALVTAASAKIPGSSHHDFPDNHVRAAYDRKVHKIILDFLN
jgi:pimeloyl-ACP methyl ester carboxylesterase